MTRFVSVIEDKTYLLWQQELQALHFKKLGIEDDLTVVVLYSSSLQVDLTALSQVCRVEVFQDLQTDKSYLPSTKPYGLGLLVEKYPEFQEDVFLVDSDVLFREVPDLTDMTDPKGLYMSNCVSYLGLDYLKTHYSDEGLERLCAAGGITLEQLRQIDKSSGGAQLYFKSLSSEYCFRVAEVSCNLYRELCRARDEEQNKVQVWTAEMWAWIWVGFSLYNLYVPKELDFCWATDPAHRWYETKILHLAGVVSKDDGLFYKGLYVDFAPWDKPDFSYVTKQDSVSWIYLEILTQLKGLKLPVVKPPKRRAIAVYLQNKPHLLTEFENMYRSYLKAGLECNTDLVVFTDDLQISLPEDVIVKYFPSISDSGVFKDYHFINSISCIAGSENFLSQYEYVLKTDVDVFLTEKFVDFFPPVFHTGVGNYTYEDVAARTEDFAKRKVLDHKGVHNIGATWYGDGRLISQVAQHTVQICETLLREETFGDWPGWYRGVASMYASELAVNHNVAQFIVSHMFDAPSDSNEPVEDVMHIHCWHTNKMYSKWAFAQGEYKGMEVPDMTTISGYCLGVALR